MAGKNNQNEQPIIKHGKLSEAVAGTLIALEISIPRVVAQRLFYDIDDIYIDVTSPLRAPSANTQADVDVQLIMSDNEPSALLDENDPKVLAYISRTSIYNATDKLFSEVSKGRHRWDSERFANFVTDDKVWLVMDGSGNSNLNVATVKMFGKMSKMSQTDYDAVILSRV